MSLSSIVEVFFLQLSPLYYIHLDYSLSRSSATTFFMPKSGAPAKNDPIFVLSPCSLQSLRTALAKYNNVLSSGSAKNFALLFFAKHCGALPITASNCTGEWKSHRNPASWNKYSVHVRWEVFSLFLSGHLKGWLRRTKGHHNEGYISDHR